MPEIQNKACLKKDLYLDIEGTLIESIKDPKFLEENCRMIKGFTEKMEPVKVHIFTWGWKTYKDIDAKLVDTLYDKLEIPQESRGDVFVKEDGVNHAIEVGWLKPDQKYMAMSYGMMGKLGYGKIRCFLSMMRERCKKECEFRQFALIDDLVVGHCSVTFKEGGGWGILIEPSELDSPLGCFRLR